MPFADPSAAEAAFYAAFRALNLEHMQAVWMQSSSTSCIHPGGDLLQGTPAILASWAEIFRNSGPPQVSNQLIQANIDARLAVHTVREDVRSGAGQRQAVILATNVYWYTDGGWQMLAHHASLPLVESRPTRDKRGAMH
jgi:hypothetical protein